MNFKASVVGALASILAFGAAAADLPSMKAPPVYAPPPWTWTGWHFGVSGGYGGGTVYTEGNLWALGPAIGAFSVNNSVGTSGFLVGIQSGYTWQLPNNYVIGYESEFNYADVRSQNNWNGLGFGVGANGAGIRWFGSERLRFGYAIGRFLPYVTGGLSYARFRHDGGGFLGAFQLPNNSSRWHAGWALGAGVEYAVWDKVSIKAEYLFSRIDGPTGASFAPGLFTTYRVRDFDTHIARVGLNYQIKNFGEFFGIPGLGI
jgi:outer membrane immunogenic protein